MNSFRRRRPGGLEVDRCEKERRSNIFFFRVLDQIIYFVISSGATELKIGSMNLNAVDWTLSLRVALVLIAG